jgi:hypothetical protein
MSNHDDANDRSRSNAAVWCVLIFVGVIATAFSTWRLVDANVGAIDMRPTYGVMNPPAEEPPASDGVWVAGILLGACAALGGIIGAVREVAVRRAAERRNDA